MEPSGRVYFDVPNEHNAEAALEFLLKLFVLLIPDHGLFTMATAWLNKFRTILSH